MATAAIIKVDPAKLLETASAFDTQSTQVSNITTEMMNLVTGLSSQWEGSASQTYVERFKSLEDDIQKLIAKVKEYVSDLEQIASVYSTYEEESVQAAQALEIDVIS